MSFRESAVEVPRTSSRGRAPARNMSRIGASERLTRRLIRRVPWHEKVTVRGLSHRLTWWGERTANPVVLLHGWMDCAETWQFLVDALPAGWSCVAPDWRGFGGTDWPADGYWFADYFADLEALLDIVCPDRAGEADRAQHGRQRRLDVCRHPAEAREVAGERGRRGPQALAADDAPAHYAEWLDQVREPCSGSQVFLGRSRSRIFWSVAIPAMPPERAAYLARRGRGRKAMACRSAFDPRHRKVGAMLFRREEAEACWRRIEAPVLLFLGGESEILPRIRPGWQRGLLPFAVSKSAHRDRARRRAHDAPRRSGDARATHRGARRRTR